MAIPSTDLEASGEEPANTLMPAHASRMPFFNKENASELGRRGAQVARENARQRKLLAKATEAELRAEIVNGRTVMLALDVVTQSLKGGNVSTERLTTARWLIDQAIGKATERTEDVTEHTDTLRVMAEAATLQAQAKLAEVELEQAKLRSLGYIEGEATTEQDAFIDAS